MIKVLLVEDNEKITENILEYFKNDMDIKNVYTLLFYHKLNFFTIELILMP